MTESCTNNPRDCPMAPRIDALEKANEQHTSTHKEIFGRLNSVERENAVQDAHYTSIMKELGALNQLVKELDSKISSLEAKPGKRWDSLVEKVIFAVAGGIIAFLLAKVGIGSV